MTALIHRIGRLAWLAGRLRPAVLPGPEAVSRVGRLALVVVFAAALALPGLAGLVAPASAALADENRPPAPFPSLAGGRAALAAFPARFEAFLNDRLGLRDRLLAWHRAVTFDWLKGSPSGRVDRGRHGWLFLNEAG